MPIPVLVATVVLGLLTGVGAVVVAAGGDGARPTTARGRGVETDAVRLLRAWDRQRARAYARGDPAALSELYVEGSRTGAADVAVLRGYRDRRLRVTGMHTQVLGADVVRRSDHRLVLEVTDVLAGAVATSGDGRWSLPHDRPSSRRVVLRRVAGEWRVEEAYVVE